MSKSVGKPGNPTIKLCIKNLYFYIFWISLELFCELFSEKQTPLLNSVQTPWNMNLLQILVSIKPLTWLKLIFRATEIWKNSYIWQFSKSTTSFFLLKYKSGTNSLWNYMRAVFIKSFSVSPFKQKRLWSLHAFLKNGKQK